jgi:hypothetical protein
MLQKTKNLKNDNTKNPSSNKNLSGSCRWNVLQLAVRSNRIDVLKYLLNLPQNSPIYSNEIFSNKYDNHRNFIDKKNNKNSIKQAKIPLQFLKGRKIAIDQSSILLSACYYDNISALNLIKNFQLISDKRGREKVENGSISLIKTSVVSPISNMMSEFYFDPLGKDISILWLSIIIGGGRCFDYLLRSSLSTPFTSAQNLIPKSHPPNPTIMTSTLLTSSSLSRNPLAPTDVVSEPVDSVNNNSDNNTIENNDMDISDKNNGIIKNISENRCYSNKNIVSTFYTIWSYAISSLVGDLLSELDTLELMKYAFNLVENTEVKKETNLYDIEGNNQNNNDITDITNDANYKNFSDFNQMSNDIKCDYNNGDDNTDNDITLCPKEFIRGLINKVYIDGKNRHGNDTDIVRIESDSSGILRTQNHENGPNTAKKTTSMTQYHSPDKNEKSDHGDKGYLYIYTL